MKPQILSRPFPLCLALLAVLGFGGTAEAEDPSSLQRVVAEGLGRSAEEALHSAWRNAVTQVVGALVDTETLVHNDKLISDKVLTFSQGYIERFTPLAQTETDGLFRVRIDAWVKKMEIRTKLTAIAALRIEEDGKSLAAGIKTRRDLGRDASALLANALEPFVRAHHITILKLMPAEPEVRDDGVTIAYEVLLAIDQGLFDQNTERLIDVLDKLGPMATAQADAHRTRISDEIRSGRNRLDNGLNGSIESNQPLVVRIQRGIEVQSWVVPPGMFPRQWLQAVGKPAGVKVRVRLLDARNKVVISSPWQCLPRNDQTQRVPDCKPQANSNRRDLRELQGRIALGDAGVGFGITNLVCIDPDVTIGCYVGTTGVPVPVRLTMELDEDRARRVVRAEAQLVAFPDISLEP